MTRGPHGQLATPSIRCWWLCNGIFNLLFQYCYFVLITNKIWYAMRGNRARPRMWHSVRPAGGTKWRPTKQKIMYINKHDNFSTQKNLINSASKWNGTHLNIYLYTFLSTLLFSSCCALISMVLFVFDTACYMHLLLLNSNWGPRLHVCYSVIFKRKPFQPYNLLRMKIRKRHMNIYLDYIVVSQCAFE